jgi:hypothetical protein
MITVIETLASDGTDQPFHVRVLPRRTRSRAEMHVRNILSKLQVSDRTEAVTIALRRGIIQL